MLWCGDRSPSSQEQYASVSRSGEVADAQSGSRKRRGLNSGTTGMLEFQLACRRQPTCRDALRPSVRSAMLYAHAMSGCAMANPDASANASANASASANANANANTKANTNG